MKKWDEIPTDEIIEATVKALIVNGISTVVTASREEAKSKALALIPAGSEVMTMTSMTSIGIGLTSEIDNSGRFQSIRNKLKSMNRNTQRREMQKLGASPEFVVGSVHAITQEGHVLIASRSGSQLPSYVSGTGRVIWVAGCQKIVENTSEGLKRIYEYCLPMEDVRARKVLGSGSEVNKILIINKEIVSQRINLILIKENIGF